MLVAVATLPLCSPQNAAAELEVTLADADALIAEAQAMLDSAEAAVDKADASIAEKENEEEGGALVAGVAAGGAVVVACMCATAWRRHRERADSIVGLSDSLEL